MMTEEEFAELRTNGIKVNYYVVCWKKLWLYSHDIRLEVESDRVALGRLLHERAYRERARRELLIDNLIKIDLLEGEGKVLEIKYSRRMKEAARLQILYYLYTQAVTQAAQEFQSHLGSISTGGPADAGALNGSFQSHLGSISTEAGDGVCESAAEFQSHLGSISTAGVHARLPERPLFQSHLGSISTGEGLSCENSIL